MTDMVPNNTMRMARTTKVYGLRRAMRTTWFMREVCQKQFDFQLIGHRLRKIGFGPRRSLDVAKCLPIVVFALHTGRHWQDVRNLLAEYRRQLCLMFRTAKHEECGLRICTPSAPCGIAQFRQTRGRYGWARSHREFVENETVGLVVFGPSNEYYRWY